MTARMTPRRRAEILARIKAKLDRNFPIGCRVRMSLAAARMWPRYARTIGTVVSHEHGVSPKVLWDGRKTASGYSPDFLVRVLNPKRRRSA